jgi:hypothetical protein
MIDHGFDPQTALDAPRFQIASGTSNGQISFEEGITDETIETLASILIYTL